MMIKNMYTSSKGSFVAPMAPILRGRGPIAQDDLLWIPKGATCESPRLLWIHGGSWEYGPSASAT